MMNQLIDEILQNILIIKEGNQKNKEEALPNYRENLQC